SAGRITAASSAMMATTQTISSRVKPACAAKRSARPADDVGRRTGSTFLPIGSVADDVISAVLAGRPVDVGLTPGIVGDEAALEIRSVPGLRPAGTLRQRGEPFRTRRIPSGVEIIEIERAAEALDLNLRRLHLGFAQIIDHARADQRHDQADDGDD